MRNRPFSRRIVPALVAGALALVVAGCGENEEDAAALGLEGEAEPVAAVAPPEGSAWSEIVVQTEDGGYLMGNADAPIRLVEFGSLTCNHCADFAETAMPGLTGDYVNSGRVAFEFRNFVRDPIDITGAMLTRCGADESFFALTDQFFANQESFFETLRGSSESAYQSAVTAPPEQRFGALAQLAGMIDFFAARGISRDQAMTCLADTALAETLANSTQAQSEKYELTGTPSFLLNGRKLDANTWEQVEAALQRAGAR